MGEVNKTEHLFVYGTLALGQPNEHILTDIGGSWEPATVKGYLHESGWGAKMGCPGLILDNYSGIIEGFLFTSNNLAIHWDDLDDFEGNEYRRMLTTVLKADGSKVQANVYTQK